MEYDQQFVVNIPCEKWTPKLESCQVGVKPRSNNERRRTDYLPTFTAFAADTAHKLLVSGKLGTKSVKKVREKTIKRSSRLTVLQIIGKLSSFWTCCAVVRQEIMMLRSKYAASLRRCSDGKNLVVEVPILYEKSNAKIMVEFELDAKSIDSWPLNMQRVKSRVKLCYSLDDLPIK